MCVQQLPIFTEASTSSSAKSLRLCLVHVYERLYRGKLDNKLLPISLPKENKRRGIFSMPKQSIALMHHKQNCATLGISHNGQLTINKQRPDKSNVKYSDSIKTTGNKIDLSTNAREVPKQSV